MEWAKKNLMHYLSGVNMVLSFEGITGKELTEALKGEAIKRLEKVEAIVYNEYQTDSQKISQIIHEVLED